MALRKEVFESKVLQKLYPAASKFEKESTSTPYCDDLTKKTVVKRSIQGNANIGNTCAAAKRIYTVIPPPPGYKADSEESVTSSKPEQLQSADPDEKSGEESSHEQARESEDKKRRRRRKKRKDVVNPLNQTAVNEGEEHLSKNKKRKLKKKRHKEKMLSMGLVPRAAAVEFTFERDRCRTTEDGKQEEAGSCQRDEASQEQEENP